MNEFPRMRAKLDAAEHRILTLEAKVKHHEIVITRVAEQINLMQQQRKPGPKPKASNGSI